MATKKPDKPTVFLLHGLGGSRADWDLALPQLMGIRAVALDLPGSGAAAKPENGYDQPSLARWLAAEIEKDGAPASVVGHSIGGRVAGELASTFPRLVKKLVLVSPLGSSSYGFTDKLKWKGMSRQSVLRSVPETSIRNASGYGFAVDGPGKKGFVERTVASRTGPDGPAVLRAVERYVDGVLDAKPLSERLKGTSMPLLVVCGKQDPLAPPEECRAILKARPDARVEEVATFGHYPMLEDPKKLAALLTAFL